MAYGLLDFSWMMTQVGGMKRKETSGERTFGLVDPTWRASSLAILILGDFHPRRGCEGPWAKAWKSFAHGKDHRG